MKLLKVFLLLIISTNLVAQDKYYTKTGQIDFFSKAPLEDITATNNQLAVILDATTGKLTFAALIKSFKFEKALMQEHFNENYLESDDFPKTKFTGSIENFQDLDLSKEGKHKIKVAGQLTIHGETKDVSVEADFIITPEGIQAETVFVVLPEDYNIKIPKSVKDNIAKEIEVNVKILLKPKLK